MATTVSNRFLNSWHGLWKNSSLTRFDTTDRGGSTRMVRTKVSGAGQSMLGGGIRDHIVQALLDSIAVTLSLLNMARYQRKYTCESADWTPTALRPALELFPFGSGAGASSSGIITILELISPRFD